MSGNVVIDEPKECQHFKRFLQAPKQHPFSGPEPACSSDIRGIVQALRLDP